MRGPASPTRLFSPSSSHPHPGLEWVLLSPEAPRPPPSRYLKCLRQQKVGAPLSSGKICCWKLYFPAQNIFTKQTRNACHHTLNYFSASWPDLLDRPVGTASGGRKVGVTLGSGSAGSSESSGFGLAREHFWGRERRWSGSNYPPCLCALFIIYDPQGPQPLAFLENGGCQEQWSQGSAFLKATVSWIRAADKGALIDFVPCAALGSWLSPMDSSLFSHTDQSLSQMRLVGGWLKSQKGQSCVGDRACSEFPTTMFLSSWGLKASLNTRSSENSPGFSGNWGWLCHFLSK